MLARALMSDRMMLLITAWVYVACLVLAATLTRVSWVGILVERCCVSRRSSVYRTVFSGLGFCFSSLNSAPELCEQHLCVVVCGGER